MTPRRLNLPNERERRRATARWHTVQRNILCWRSTAVCVVQPAHIPKFKDGQAQTDCVARVGLRLDKVVAPDTHF
jgi:hypothetical protein